MKSRMGLLLAILLAPARLSAAPAVHFNADEVVRCRDVTPADCATPDGRLIEATFRISALVAAGREADLDYVLYTVFDGKKHKTLQVVDYLPKTEMDTDVPNPAVVIESKTSESRLSGTIAAGYKLVAKADLQANRADRSASVVEYRRLPPRRLVVAAGIAERGYGVFWKLKPSPQATLEGDRTVSCIFAVPKGWRADHLQVHCRAVYTRRSVFDADPGFARFVVGLHLEGDAEAERKVRDLVRAQQRMLDEPASDWRRKLETGIGLRCTRDR